MKKILALKFSQEIRTETRISNFNLKGVGGGGWGWGWWSATFTFGGIFVCGGGGGEGMSRIIHLRGDVIRIIHRKT